MCICPWPVGATSALRSSIKIMWEHQAGHGRVHAVAVQVLQKCAGAEIPHATAVALRGSAADTSLQEQPGNDSGVDRGLETAWSEVEGTFQFSLLHSRIRPHPDATSGMLTVWLCGGMGKTKKLWECKRTTWVGNEVQLCRIRLSFIGQGRLTYKDFDSTLTLTWKQDYILKKKHQPPLGIPQREHC